MAKTTLPAKVEQWTALQAQSSFTAAEKAAYKDLRTRVDQIEKDTIWWYWELGKKIQEIYKDAQSDQELYGANLLDRLGIALGFSNGRPLRESMQVVDTFGTKKLFMTYVKLKGEAGNSLSWSHLKHLAKIGDDDRRMQLASTAVAKNQTADVLRQRVQEYCDSKKRGSGRKPKTKIPTTARSMLTHVTSQSNKFIENFDKAWTGDAFSITDQVHEIPSDKLDDKLTGALAATKVSLEDMRDRADELIDQLMAAEEDVEKRMKAQAEADEAAAEEAELEEEEYEDDELEEEEYEEVEYEEDDEEEEEENEDVVAEVEEDEEEEEEEDDDEVVSLSEERNRKERAKRAAERAKKRKRTGKQGPTRRGRVGI